MLAQTGVDLELLVVDDASQPPIATQLADLHTSRVKQERNAQNLGLVGNWNRCLELATGDPVLLFHQDDRMRPGFLAKSVAMLERYPEAGFVFSNVVTIDASGRESGGHWSPQALPSADAYVPGGEVIRRLLAYGNFIPCQTVVVRAAAYSQAGWFDPRLGYTPDLDMWLRLASRWGAAYLADQLVEIRRHHGQESHRYMGTTREIDEVRRAFQSILMRLAAHDYTTEPPLPVESRRLARKHLQTAAMMGMKQSLRNHCWKQALGFAVLLARLRAAGWLGHPC